MVTLQQNIKVVVPSSNNSNLIGARRPETHFARGSGEGWSGEERRVLNRFVGGMAIVRVRSRRKEHGRTNGSSVLYTHT